MTINDLPMAEIDGAHTLRFVRRVDASPERVWRALTDSDELLAWTGMQLLVEPRVGGRVVAQPGEGWVFDFEPPHLLRFSAADPNNPEHVKAAKKAWTISWELIPDGDGTRIIFIHRFLRGDILWGLGEGWHGFLDQLLAYVNDGVIAAPYDVAADLARPAAGDDGLARYRVHVARSLRANARASATDVDEVRAIADALYFIAIQPSDRPDYSLS